MWKNVANGTFLFIYDARKIWTILIHIFIISQYSYRFLSLHQFF